MPEQGPYRDLFYKMMADFLGRHDMKSMGVTGKEMNQIGSMAEAVMIQKAMIEDHKRVIANLEQASVHLQGIETERGWAFLEPETENGA